jgi:adenine C2-methylase RlmN of 23S rRNA A2503 and tRNA A37
MSVHIYSVHPDDLQLQILAAGFKAFRFRQLVKWLYQKHENDISLMTDLPADFGNFLVENYDFSYFKATTDGKGWFYQIRSGTG